MYKKILVAVDLTADTSPIVERAKALAKIHGAEISLLHVIEPVPLVTPFDVPDVMAPTVLQTQDELAAGAQKRLEKLAADLGVPPKSRRSHRRQHAGGDRPRGERRRRRADRARRPRAARVVVARGLHRGRRAAQGRMRRPRGPGQAEGLTRANQPIAGRIASFLFLTNCSNVCRAGFSLRAVSALRAASISFSKSRYAWNMLPISSAPGNPKPR